MKLIRMNIKFIEIFYKEKYSDMPGIELMPSFVETPMLYSPSYLGS
jgi:hypothetical protein